MCCFVIRPFASSSISTIESPVQILRSWGSGPDLEVVGVRSRSSGRGSPVQIFRSWESGSDLEVVRVRSRSLGRGSPVQILRLSDHLARGLPTALLIPRGMPSLDASVMPPGHVTLPIRVALRRMTVVIEKHGHLSMGATSSSFDTWSP